MGKRILRLYLAKNDTPYSAAYAKLELPASPWELWDAMEKVRLQTDDILYMEIEDYFAFEYLSPHLDGLDISLNELNDLAAQLAALDEVQGIAFEGMFSIRNRAATAAAHWLQAHDGAGRGAAAKRGVKGARDEQLRDRDAEERTDHREERSAVNETAPRVIKIPAKPESVRQAELQRQLRVAAYCRVSTKEEDQANSYEVQKEYYQTKK